MKKFFFFAAALLASATMFAQSDGVGQNPQECPPFKMTMVPQDTLVYDVTEHYQKHIDIFFGQGVDEESYIDWRIRFKDEENWLNLREMNLIGDFEVETKEDDFTGTGGLSYTSLRWKSINNNKVAEDVNIIDVKCLVINSCGYESEVYGVIKVTRDQNRYLVFDKLIDDTLKISPNDNHPMVNLIAEYHITRNELFRKDITMEWTYKEMNEKGEGRVANENNGFRVINSMPTIDDPRGGSWLYCPATNIGAGQWLFTLTVTTGDVTDQLITRTFKVQTIVEIPEIDIQADPKKITVDQENNTITLTNVNIKTDDGLVEIPQTVITITTDDVIIQIDGQNTLSAQQFGIETGGSLTVKGIADILNELIIEAPQPIFSSKEDAILTIMNLTMTLTQNTEGNPAPRRAPQVGEEHSVIEGFADVNLVNCCIVEPAGAYYDTTLRQLICNGEVVKYARFLALNQTGINEYESQNENLKAIVNGQLIIIRGDKIYNAFGGRMK